MKKYIFILIVVLISFCLLLSPVSLLAADPDFIIIPGRNYHVLTDEFLTGSNNDILLRSYTLYNGARGTIDDYGSLHYGTEEISYDSIVLGQSFFSTAEAKKHLEKVRPEDLRLPPMTIVSEKVFNQWIREDYRQNEEYSESSPRGLILADITPDEGIIFSPSYAASQLTLNFPSHIPNIGVNVNGTPLKFTQDKPYISETGEILLPFRTLASVPGYSISYPAVSDLYPAAVLTNGSRIITVSPWRDDFNINGLSVDLGSLPRLSVHDRILVPASLLYFMNARISWDGDSMTLNIITG